MFFEGLLGTYSEAFRGQLHDTKYGYDVLSLVVNKILYSPRARVQPAALPELLIQDLFDGLEVSLTTLYGCCHRGCCFWR